MDSQVISQSLDIVVGGNGLPATGGNALLLFVVGLLLVVGGVLVVRCVASRSLGYGLVRRVGVLVVLVAVVASVSVDAKSASAVPSVVLAAGQDTLSVSVPVGGGSASVNTSVTSGSSSPDGYVLSVELLAGEPGISVSVKGGSVVSSTALSVGGAPLVLKSTSVGSSGDVTQLVLSFSVDGSVKAGKKALRLSYVVTDNEPSGPVVPTTLQSMSQAYCDSLSVYDGSNESAVLSLSDVRDAKMYRVAKLADGNCWMLDNLKLGSTTGTTILTPADSDVSANFTLPQLTTSGSAEYDIPGVYGPVPGDTGSGATHYGYLYNWSAVSAGESRTSHPETAGDAPNSICAKGWRLPSGGFDMNTNVPLPSNEFNELSARMAGFPNGQDNTYLANYSDYYQGWQNNGPFKGSFAGYWVVAFVVQGDFSGLWSASALPDDDDNAFGAYFGAGEIGPAESAERYYGLSVRCLLN